MKAVILTGAGGTDMLKLTEIPDPIIENPQEVLVRIHAAGLNPVDWKLRRVGGFYPDRLPLILGCDGAGVVEAVGEAVTKLNVGDEVYFFNGGMGGDDQGNYAEFTVIHQAYLAAKPTSISMVEAASVPLVWLTAWESLFDRYALKAGDTVLIHGGAGGVGYIAIQIAKSAGAEVFTTISSPEKAEFARSIGADHCLNYKEENFVDAVLALTDGKGVDVVFDVIGGQMFEDGEYYVPEMLIAARAMQAGLGVLKPHLVATGVEPIGKVVIGTVQGDMHDIGKNLVTMMLEGAGFEVIDLGVDANSEQFVAAIRENEPQVVAMSALLTTTMPKMKLNIDAMREAGVLDSVRVIVGGAPVTAEFAANIGASGYAPDASQAATLAKSSL